MNSFERIDMRMDKGGYLENIAFREFLLGGTRIEDIKFWRTQAKNEVDFVIDEQKIFEVKFSEKQIKPSKVQKISRIVSRYFFGIFDYE